MTADKLGSVALATLISISAACFIAATIIRLFDELRRSVSLP